MYTLVRTKTKATTSIRNKHPKMSTFFRTTHTPRVFLQKWDKQVNTCKCCSKSELAVPLAVPRGTEKRNLVVVTYLNIGLISVGA